MKEYTNRLSVSHSLIFECQPGELWQLISEPGSLNKSHPFCKSNDVLKWEKQDHSDRLVYLNGLDYTRKFLTWNEGLGYTLFIGSAGGPQSYVVWEINSKERDKSELTITVYPYLLANLPFLIAYIPHIFWVRPRLKKYLNSVLAGYQFHLENGEEVPRNHFGKHPWFS